MMPVEKRRILTVVGLLLLVPLSACAGSATTKPATTLNVFAATSLSAAFTEIGQAFHAEHADVEVVFNFAGSQLLGRQIAEGAQADVFASADYRQMDVAVQSGRVAADGAEMFARNLLVVVYPVQNPAGLTQLSDLARPGVKLILADVSVPVGQYTREFLEKAGQEPALGADYATRVLNNVVSYEMSVKGVLNKIVLGEADAGVVYASDLGVYASDLGTESTPEVGRLAIPADLNVLAAYFIAPVRDAPNAEAASDFVDFVRKQGQAILSKHGFLAGE